MAVSRRDVFLRGKCKYPKIQDRGDMSYQCWSTTLYLTPESYNQFVDLKAGSDGVEGIMNDIKKDEDGYYVTLRRPWARKYKGVEVAFSPPIILGPDNMPWPGEKALGSGSDLTCKCEYYTFKPQFKPKRGSAIRLVSVRVEDYVPFEGTRDFTSDEQQQVKGLTDMKPMIDKPPF